ncbi:hypothetical protein BN1088_1430719 [Sphingobacterium sp. PM2-P1-29]|nr:hypothetical protein BN1088_1430719 [Sphingobacterium sp. PM2-P1-29]
MDRISTVCIPSNVAGNSTYKSALCAFNVNTGYEEILFVGDSFFDSQDINPMKRKNNRYKCVFFMVIIFE